MVTVASEREIYEALCELFYEASQMVFTGEDVNEFVHSDHSSYGFDWESESLLMKPYCWCEKEDCPWCMTCECTESSYKYFIDGKEVSYKEWLDFYLREEEKGVDPDEIDRRRSETFTPECEYCLNGRFPETGAEPGTRAPNFWYKPLNFKVWWYKYLGRGMEFNKELTKQELKDLIADCKRVFNSEKNLVEA